MLGEVLDVKMFTHTHDSAVMPNARRATYHQHESSGGSGQFKRLSRANQILLDFLRLPQALASQRNAFAQFVELQTPEYRSSSSRGRLKPPRTPYNTENLVKISFDGNIVPRVSPYPKRGLQRIVRVAHGHLVCCRSEASLHASHDARPTVEQGRRFHERAPRF